MVILPLIAVFIIVGNVAAQKMYIVKAGEVPAEVMPAEALYAFPKFIQGMAYQRDGTVSAAKFNYNIMLDEMQFISNKGDTLTIAYPETIKKIVLNGAEFFYDKAYLQVIASIDSFKIAAKEFYVQSPYRTRGGYDAPTAASSITTYARLNSSRSSANLQVKKDVRFDKHTSYFISDRYNHFFIANKQSFFRLFSNKKTELDVFIKDNTINFSDLKDVEKVLRFATTNP